MAGPVLGAITTGSPTVLVGGFPMVNIPNPAQDLLNRLKRFAAKKAAALKDRLSGPKG
jgi:hypothetical protein